MSVLRRGGRGRRTGRRSLFPAKKKGQMGKKGEDARRQISSFQVREKGRNDFKKKKKKNQTIAYPLKKPSNREPGGKTKGPAGGKTPHYVTPKKKSH